MSLDHQRPVISVLRSFDRPQADGKLIFFFFILVKDVSGFVIIRYFFVTDDSLIDESPLPMSILKKASKFRNKKLDASIANYSKVEISPGLFVKRPSSKTKMPPPAPLEPNTHQKSQVQQNILPVVKVEQIHEKKSGNDMSVDIGLESPQMPKLKTIDLKKIMKEKKVNEPVLGEIIFCMLVIR